LIPKKGVVHLGYRFLFVILDVSFSQKIIKRLFYHKVFDFSLLYAGTTFLDIEKIYRAYVFSV